MTYLNTQIDPRPKGFQKILALNWPVLLLLCAISSAGFLMLYSVADGHLEIWAEPQMKRFAMGMAAIFVIAMIPIQIWRNISVFAYIGALLLLVGVHFVGVNVNGSQRWIDLGPLRLQPSEVMKIALIMVLAAYYDWLPLEKTSRPFWVLVPLILIFTPVAFVFEQPDLGTSLLLAIGGGAIMFLAGVHWGYFLGAILGGLALIYAILLGEGQSWQLLSDYQHSRINTFLDESSDTLGDSYHIIQGKIAFGSGGWTGRGFMQGTQTQLDFLPEKHTDFIFNTLAEEFGFVGAATLLMLYTLVLLFCAASATQNRDRFGSLFTLGIGVTLFMFFSVNMAMVTGLIPVVGVPLPLVSYGGTAMLILLLGFGVMQSAHVHMPRGKMK